MRRMLVITHQLSRSGAPMVLLGFVKICKKLGYNVQVISMWDGELKKEFYDMDISVMILREFYKNREIFLSYVVSCDIVLANTLVTCEAIQILQYVKKPVIWWIHEGREYFEYLSSILPDFKKLPVNIRVVSVSHNVKDVIQDIYGYDTEVLHFGIEDIPRKSRKISDTNKVKFLMVGQYSVIKAQDILVQAILGLSERYIERSEFIFCGDENTYDEQEYALVKRLSEMLQNVKMLHVMPHTELMCLMEQCDCLVVPSRMETVSAVAVEMLMKENLCLCTEVCGIAHYIKDGINGFIVPSEKPAVLTEKIKFIIDNNEKLDLIRKNGRKIYEENFSMLVMETHVELLLKEMRKICPI